MAVLTPIRENPGRLAWIASGCWITTKNGTEANERMKQVVIIGGGLAGCASAEAFSRRGWQVQGLVVGE